MDVALSRVLPETPGVKTRSVMPTIKGLTLNMYLSDDRTNLSEGGLNALISYIFTIIDKE